MLQTPEELFPIELDFGDKKLHFRVWKGKERRVISTLIEDEGIDYKKIYNILTYGCMQEQDVYLTEDETLYVLYVLKSKSIDDFFVFDYMCSECNTLNTEVAEFNNILVPKLTQYEDILIKTDEGNITFKIGEMVHNSHNKSNIMNINNSFDRKFYELVLSVKGVIIDVDGKKTEIDEFSFIEIMTFIDNLKASIFDELISKFKLQQFIIKPSIICVCENEECKHESKVEIDIIPNFIDDWM